MQFLIISCIVVAAAAQRLQNRLDPETKKITTTTTPTPPGPVIPILEFLNKQNPNGTYVYKYVTGNGISAEEQGFIKESAENGDVQVKTGEYAYQSPEGVNVEVGYSADENGFQPFGDVLPTPPEIPELILRALAVLATKKTPTEENEKIYKGK